MLQENLFSKHLLIQSSIHSGLDQEGLTTEFEKLESKNGGSYRFINEDEKGNKFAFHGFYHEVLAPERVIGTFEYEGLSEKGHVSLEITKFEELPGGRPKLAAQDVFLSVADRDGMVQSGTEEGVTDSYDRLEELVAAMKQKPLAENNNWNVIY